MKKKFLIFISVFILVGISRCIFASDNSKDVSLTQEEILVQVGPEKITKSDYNAYMQYRQIELKKRGLLFSPQDVQNFQKKVLDEIVEQTMVFLLALRENIVCSDEMFNNIYKEGISLLGGEEEYHRWLKSCNLTDEYIKEQIKKKNIVEQYIQSIEKTVSVTDKEVEETYQNYVKLGWAKRNTDTYDFANILIIDFIGDSEKEKQINAIYKRIQKGEDFFLLAQQFSEDSFSRKQGYCYYEMPLKQVLPEAKHYLVMCPVGSVSPPFRTRNGWNILKILSKNTPGTIPFQKMKQGIYHELINKKVREILKQELEKLQKEINITYYSNYK